MKWEQRVQRLIQARRQALLASSNPADTLGMDHPEDREADKARIVKVNGVELLFKSKLTLADFPDHPLK